MDTYYTKSSLLRPISIGKDTSIYAKNLGTLRLQPTPISNPHKTASPSLLSHKPTYSSYADLPCFVLLAEDPAEPRISLGGRHIFVEGSIDEGLVIFTRC